MPINNNNYCRTQIKQEENDRDPAVMICSSVGSDLTNVCRQYHVENIQLQLSVECNWTT